MEKERLNVARSTYQKLCNYKKTGDEKSVDPKFRYYKPEELTEDLLVKLSFFDGAGMPDTRETHGVLVCIGEYVYDEKYNLVLAGEDDGFAEMIRFADIENTKRYLVDLNTLCEISKIYHLIYPGRLESEKEYCEAYKEIQAQYLKLLLTFDEEEALRIIQKLMNFETEAKNEISVIKKRLKEWKNVQ